MWVTGEDKVADAERLIFADALVVTVAFLITGFLLDNWHPGWMLFLTIPLYYVLIFGR